MTPRGAFHAILVAVLLLATASVPAAAGGGTNDKIEESGTAGDNPADIETSEPDASETEASETEASEPEPAPAPPGPPVSLSAFEGRWTGEGKLGVKDNPPESVKCRATYFPAEKEAGLKQNIRCATAGGAIEVKSELINANGKLTGTWAETMHNLSGTLEGELKPAGLRIVVKGEGLHANMDIIVRDGRQIVEIQFFDSTLIGLTLVLNKG